MYKILIVDDERIIRESISKMIDWEACGFTLVGAAANGIEALKIIDDQRPDLVITDMKMPLITGNQLAEKTKAKYPDTVFAILSGHDDFTFVSEAMKSGVNHYILKPCSENDIIKVLNDVSDTLRQREERNNFIRKNNEKLEKIIPLVKEQFIRDFVMSKHYAEEEMAYFMKLFGISNKLVRVILLRPSGDYSFNTLFGLTNMIDKQMMSKNIYFKTIINKYVVLIIENMAEERIENALSEILDIFKHLTNIDLVISYSDEGTLEEVSNLFVKAQEYLDFAFYFDSSCIISQKDVEEGLMVNSDEHLEVQELIMAVRSGNEHLFNERVDNYFSMLFGMKPDIATFRFHCIELASGIMRQCALEKSREYIGQLLEIQTYETFDQIHQAIVSIGASIAKQNYSGIVVRQNNVVKNMLDEIEQRIADEKLSLKTLANDVMYMNSGYLSKLFSKEMGITFSGYLTKQRMERSKMMIDQATSFKVYEIAEAIGMGNNPQYFSQSFKKYTGMTPSEYKHHKGN